MDHGVQRWDCFPFPDIVSHVFPAYHYLMYQLKAGDVLKVAEYLDGNGEERRKT